ncbi:hypothetical protein ACP70R_024470 [Stipagrostis hirtigluma subsp. patula]
MCDVRGCVRCMRALLPRGAVACAGVACYVGAPQPAAGVTNPGRICMEDKMLAATQARAREQAPPPPSSISIPCRLPRRVGLRTVQFIREHAMEEEAAVAAAVTAASGTAPGGGRAEAAARTAPELKVVAAVDASEESLRALSWALDNVVAPHPGATLVVVHAQHAADHFVYPIAAHGIGIAYASSPAVETLRKAEAENSRRIVARALDICKAKQVDAPAAIVEGDAKEAICEAVERMHADLLVLGSRGLGKIKRALLGSVSDYLTHHASCPVLVVKPTKAHAK